MTVSQVGKDHLGQPTVWCEWFDGTKLIKDTFRPEALKLAEED
jgi:uncharacterized protein YodC (DUF2158 family)